MRKRKPTFPLALRRRLRRQLPTLLPYVSIIELRHQTAEQLYKGEITVPQAEAMLKNTNALRAAADALAQRDAQLSKHRQSAGKLGGVERTAKNADRDRRIRVAKNRGFSVKTIADDVTIFGASAKKKSKKNQANRRALIYRVLAN